jgi:heptosyltransferase I
MPRTILIVKTSSMGDVIHTLPAITDLKRIEPDCIIDWLVEQPFADMPSLHAGVRRVIACNLRQWRRSPFSAKTRSEYQAMVQAFAPHYDAVIDCQGLLKSVWLAGKAPGELHGYDWASAREPLASLSYKHRHRIGKAQHAVQRNRQLVAASLGYTLPDQLDYGLPLSTQRAPAVYCIHATSKSRKLWPEKNWLALIAWLDQRGYRALLPWGDAAEEARAKRLAAQTPSARVLPRQSIAALAERMPQASLAIGVDTGLLHLAAALGVPCLGLYVSSDPALAGALGGLSPCINLGGKHETPSLVEVLKAAEQLLPLQSP